MPVNIIEGTSSVRMNAIRFQNAFQSGLREACEDSVCKCENLADADQYKLCKEKCFREQAEAITGCCINQCPIANNADCITACKEALKYSVGNPNTDRVTTFQKTENNPGCAIL